MGNIWLIADTHFGHANIIRYCDRPFASADKMDEAMIANWNNVVKADDKVFHLGDFALCDAKRIVDIGQRLNGYKILIRGNHDGASDTTYRLAGFKQVSKYPILIEDFLILSHEPVFVNERQCFANIFGHVHNNENYRTFSPDGACVSVERHNYAPVLLDDVRSAIELLRFEKLEG